MEHWSSELKVAKMPRAFSHAPRASLALDPPINSAEPRIAQAAYLRPALLHCLAVMYFRHRHLPLQQKQFEKW